MTVSVKVDLRGSLGSVRDQGNRPTCLSQATTLAHEHCRGSKVALSPEYLHFFASDRRPANAVNMKDMSTALKKDGQPREVDCPYLAAPPQPGWKPPRGAQVFRRKSTFRSASAADVRAVIRAGHLPVIAIRLPRPFYYPQAPFIIPAQGPFTPTMPLEP